MAKLYIKTYGCQMNVYDSVKMEGLLKPHGFENTPDMLEADLVVLNTCHIREKASEKVYSELGRIKKKRDNRASNSNKMMIAVAGCVAQAEGEEIFRRAPYVDIVVGPQSYQNLPELIERAKREKGWVIDLDFPTSSKFDSLPEEDDAQGVCAFLTIQEGCDKFCHFCCVPFTRGAEYSRSVSEIYRDAVRLASGSAREITLLGQNVSAYHGKADGNNIFGMGKLIKHLSTIKGLERTRYMTSHPNDMLDQDLLDAHANISSVMPFLHLPVQSGSNRILKAMNRKHDRDHYFKIIDMYRAARPDMAFSSDFIVGYPSESDQDFEDTLDLIRRVNYAQAYSFKYSPRPGTAAATLDTQVPEDIKNERLSVLQALLSQQQTAFNKNMIGKKTAVLFDRIGRNANQFQGKSPYNQTVLVSSHISLIGQTHDVLIESATHSALRGNIIK